MFGRKSISGSVEWLIVSAPLRNNGPPWTDNMLVPSLAWGAGGTATNSNWGDKPGGPYDSVTVLWSGPIHAMCFQKIPTALRVVSVKNSFRIIVRIACKVSPLSAASSVIIWSIDRIAVEMISGMSQLINNLCGEFPFLV